MRRIEGSLQQDDDEQDDAQREVGRLRVGVAERFPVGIAGFGTVSESKDAIPKKRGCAPGDEAENGGDGQQRAKAAEEVPEDLRRSESSSVS